MKRKAAHIEDKCIYSPAKKQKLSHNNNNFDQVLSAEKNQITLKNGFPMCTLDASCDQLIDLQTNYSHVATFASVGDILNIVDTFYGNIAHIIIEYLAEPMEFKPRAQLMFKLDDGEQCKYNLRKITPKIKSKHNAFCTLSRTQIFESWQTLPTTAIFVVPYAQISQWRTKLQDRKDVKFYVSNVDMQDMEIPEDENPLVVRDFTTKLSIQLYDLFRWQKIIVVSASKFDRFAFTCIKCDLTFGRVFFVDADNLRIPSMHVIHASRYWTISEHPQNFVNLANSGQHFLRWMLKQDKSNFHAISLK